jgi:ferredoxin
MKLTIKDFCIRCGLCQDLYPEIFAFDFAKDEMTVKFETIPAELEGKATAAMGDCAIAAIHKE